MIDFLIFGLLLHCTVSAYHSSFCVFLLLVSNIFVFITKSQEIHSKLQLFIILPALGHTQHHAHCPEINLLQTFKDKSKNTFFFYTK